MKAAPGMRDVSFSGVFESLRPLLPIGTRMSATRLWRRLVSMPELCENEPGSTAKCFCSIHLQDSYPTCQERNCRFSQGLSNVEYRLVPFMDVYQSQKERQRVAIVTSHILQFSESNGHLESIWASLGKNGKLVMSSTFCFGTREPILPRSNCRGQNGGKWAFARASAFLECYRPWPDLTAFSWKKCGDVGRLAAGIQSIEKFASWLPWMVWEFWGSRAGWKHCKRLESSLRLDHALEAISWHRLLFSGWFFSVPGGSSHHKLCNWWIIMVGKSLNHPNWSYPILMYINVYNWIMTPDTPIMIVMNQSRSGMALLSWSQVGLYWQFCIAYKKLMSERPRLEKTVDVFEVGNQPFPGDAFLVIGSDRVHKEARVRSRVA